MPEVFSAERAVKDAKKSVDVIVAEAKKMFEEKGGSSPFSSLIVLPKKVKFEAQNEGETIILIARSHFITQVWWLAVASFMVFVPMFWSEFPLVAGVNQATGFGLMIVWYLGLGFFVLERLLLWFYNVYIVTDERVIDVDFFEIFYKNVDVTPIKNIEEVNYRQVGVATSVFNYGDVIIQTSSEQATSNIGKESAAFTFEAVPNPDRVVRVLSELMEQEEREAVEGRVR
jgi:hypothetical protein